MKTDKIVILVNVCTYIRIADPVTIVHATRDYDHFREHGPQLEGHENTASRFVFNGVHVTSKANKCDSISRGVKTNSMPPNKSYTFFVYYLTRIIT